ncbi:MAG: response regulator transcription factor [Rhodoferax sp.]|nr:response regulator transcription factor [Actinomycetota bacterium]
MSQRPAPDPLTPGPRVLVVEDDEQLATMLSALLVDEGYAVDVARDGQRGLHLGLSGRYDVMLIDRGLPAIEGVDLVRRLRNQGVTAPVLVLTARGTAADRVEGLDAGAEDYLVKPFDVDELLARLRALLRRHREDSDELDLGVRRLVVASRTVVEDGGPDVVLSGRECELLLVLARRPGRVFGRDELLRRVFDDADTTGSVDTYVHYLRRKLGREVVHTVRGSGYRMGSA